ncbi:hypothetical protein ACH5RR_010631 [Cinchona calisaya]|uniref:Uncharacterized protein n=1 Tax=Cinchona calisaya TaxID=153742 RepID=A0ABD3AJH3_9GENT
MTIISAAPVAKDLHFTIDAGENNLGDVIRGSQNPSASASSCSHAIDNQKGAVATNQTPPIVQLSRIDGFTHFEAASIDLTTTPQFSATEEHRNAAAPELSTSSFKAPATGNFFERKNSAAHLATTIVQTETDDQTTAPRSHIGTQVDKEAILIPPEVIPIVFPLWSPSKTIAQLSVYPNSHGVPWLILPTCCNL